MKTTVKIISTLLVLYIGFVAYVFKTIPEDMLVIHATSKEYDPNFTASLIPKSLVRETFKLTGFKGCTPESDPVSPSTWLMTLVSGYDSGDIDFENVTIFIDIVLEQGCDINEKSIDGMTALHSTGLFGNARMAEYLLQKGADPYVRIERPGKNSHEMTALQLAQFVHEKDKDPRYKEVIEVLGQAITEK